VEWINDDNFITAIGCNLAIGSVSKPDKYIFLEGHSQFISTFCLNKSRTLCASGQSGPESHSDPSVPVIVWDLIAMKQKIVLRGHEAPISCLSFTENSRLLAVLDEKSNRIWIWDILEQDLGTFIPLTAHPSTIVFGGNIENKWFLHVTINMTLYQYEIVFDNRTFEYKHNCKPYQNPTNGYRRTYNASSFALPNFFVGSLSGEISVYNSISSTIRSVLEVDKYPIADICPVCDTNIVLVGGGTLSIVSGDDKQWSINKQINLGSPIVSISCIGKKALIRTIDTNLHIVDVQRGNHQILSQGIHAPPLMFALSNTHVALALGSAGVCILSYQRGVLEHASSNPSIKAKAVAKSPNNEFIFGLIDGTLVCMNTDGNIKWRTEHVHKGSVTALCITNDFIASGGEDGVIRLLTHKTRTILNEIIAHSAPILKIIPALGQPKWVHSVAADRTLTTTDITTGKRICQQQSEGRIGFTSIIQFNNGENEILVSKGDGTLVGYDWPRVGIVLSFESPYRLQINSISLKPNSRIVACGGEHDRVLICNCNDYQWAESDVSHSSPINCLEWSPDGSWLISAAHDGICLWKHE